MPIYYVRKTGNDGNSGLSPAQAKLTLNAVEDLPVVPGDTVYIGAGTYREQLTCDVSGTALLPISYIGDYSGTYTGDAGVVRITGSNDDLAWTRSNAIVATTKTYRTFKGLKFDLSRYQLVNAQTTCANWIIDQCYFGNSFAQAIVVTQPGTDFVIQNSFFGGGATGSVAGIFFTHSSTLDNRNITVQNCIIKSYFYGIGSTRIGGIVVKNSTILGCSRGVSVITALAAGQTLTVTNSILANHITRGLEATVAGELVENYNSFFGNVADRFNVATGANSNTYPPLFDSRWFFESVK